MSEQTASFQLTDGMTVSFTNIKQFVATPYDYRIIHNDGTIRLVNRMQVVAVELSGDVPMPVGTMMQ
jgi:hypothetical protein